MAKKSKPYTLKWPLTASQLESIEKMFEQLYKQTHEDTVTTTSSSSGSGGSTNTGSPSSSWWMDIDTGLSDALVARIPGPTGATGAQGPQGIPGQDGDDAYDPWPRQSAGSGAAVAASVNMAVISTRVLHGV